MFLVRRPRLWPLAALPSLLVGAFLVLGLILGAVVSQSLGTRLASQFSSLPDWLSLLITVLLWCGIMAAGMVLGVGAALVLVSPLLDRLSRKVELLARGSVAEADTRLGWEVAQALRGALYFVLAAPGVFLLGLIPVLGPALGLLWGGHALSLQETDGPLSRRGLDFRARRAWHRQRRPESLGFGIAGLIPLLFFPVNLVLAPLFAPALVAGATLLVLELHHDVAPAAASEPTADAPGPLPAES
jgi:CysZ protein